MVPSALDVSRSKLPDEAEASHGEDIAHCVGVVAPEPGRSLADPVMDPVALAESDGGSGGTASLVPSALDAFR